MKRDFFRKKENNTNSPDSKSSTAPSERTCPHPIEMAIDETSCEAVCIELAPDDQVTEMRYFLPEELKEDPLVNSILSKTATETVNEWLQSLRSLSDSERQHAAATTLLFRAECHFLHHQMSTLANAHKRKDHYFTHDMHLKPGHINLIKLIHRMLAHHPSEWWMAHFTMTQLIQPSIQSALSACLLSGNPITSSLLEDIKNNPDLVVLMHFIAQFESTTSSVSHQHLTRLRQQLEHMTAYQQHRFKTSLEVLTKDGVPESALKVISHALLFTIGLRQHWSKEAFVAIGTELSINKPARELAYTINKLHRSACWCLKTEYEEQLQHLFTFVDAAMCLLLIHHSKAPSIQKKTHMETSEIYHSALEHAREEQHGHNKRAGAIETIHSMMTEQRLLVSTTSQQHTHCERAAAKDHSGAAATALLLRNTGAEERGTGQEKREYSIPPTQLPKGFPPLVSSETPRKEHFPHRRKHTAFPSLVYFDRNRDDQHPEEKDAASSTRYMVG